MRIKTRSMRALSLVLAVLLMIPTSMFAPTNAAVYNGVVLELTVAEIAAAVRDDDTGYYTVDSVPTVTVVDETGAVLDNYEEPALGTQTVYELAGSVEAFVERLDLGEEQAERDRIAQALADKLYVKDYSGAGYQAIVVMDEDADLTLLVVNTSTNRQTFTLAVTDGEGRTVELRELGALVHSTLIEELDENALAARRAAGLDVEILEVTETVNELQPEVQEIEEPLVPTAPRPGTEQPVDGPAPADETAGESEEQEDPAPADEQGEDEEPQEDDSAEEPVIDEDEGDDEPASTDDDGDRGEPDDEVYAMLSVNETREVGQDAGDGDETEEPETEELETEEPDETVNDNEETETEGDDDAEELADDGDARQPAETPAPDAQPAYEMVGRQYVAAVTYGQAAGAQVNGNSLTLQVDGGKWAVADFGVTVGDPLPGEVVVTFDPNNGEEPFAGKMKDDGTVEEPQVPAIPANMRTFLGWYAAGAQEPFDFDTVLTESTTLTAEYSTKLVIQFKDYSGKVIETQLVEFGGYIRPLSYAGELGGPLGLDFAHWYVEGDSEDTPFDIALPLIENHLVLRPYFADSHYVYFQSRGSAVETQIVKSGEKATAPPRPERVGYTFRFWSTNPDATSTRDAFNFATPITGQVTLYGIWEAQRVGYTMVYWVEKPNLPLNFDKSDPDNYMYVASEAKTGYAGALTGPSAAGSKILNNNEILKKYAEYSSALELNRQTKPLAGDGTTVVNAYYTRKVYTVTFNMNSSASMVFNGGTYYGKSSGNNRYVMQAKYEMDIAAIWPSQGDGVEFTGTTSTFVGWKYSNTTWVTRRIVFTSDMIPSSGTTYTVTAQWSSKPSLRTVNYWLEALSPEDDGAVRHSNGKYYVNDTDYQQTYYSASTSLSAKDIDGFEYKSNIKHPNANTMPSGTYHFYYNRLSYNLNFNLKGGETSETTSYSGVPYGMALRGYEPQAEPTRTGYIFDGWYANSDADGERFDFGAETMPNAALTLYAGWKPSAVIITFYDAKGGDVLARDGIVKYGTVTVDAAEQAGYVVNQPSQGYGTLRAWLWEVNGRLVPFDFDGGFAPSEHLNLYAAWDTMGFSLAYGFRPEDDISQQPPTDDNTYALNVLAVVKELPGNVTPPSGKVFVGWQVDGKGATYYPGTTLAMYGDLTLYAKFVDENAELVTLTYHSRYPGSDKPDESINRQVERGDRVVLEGAIFEYGGWKLTGWTDGASNEYDFGDNVTVNEDLELNAVWEADNRTVTFVVDGVGGTLDGETEIVVPYGTPWRDITPPKPVSDDGYYFAGWDNSFPSKESGILTDMTFKARFAEKTELVVTAASAEKVYDGEPLVAMGYTTRPQGFTVEGISVLGSRTEAGNTLVNVIPTSEIVVKNGDEVVTDRYTIEYRSGKLVVHERPVLVTGVSDTRTFDNTLQVIDSFEVETRNDLNNSGLLAGHSIVAGVSAYGARTAPGTAAVLVTVGNDLKIVDTNNNDKDVTDNYDVSKADGLLTVEAPDEANKTPWEIVVDGKTVPYNGQPQTHRGAITTNGLMEGHELVEGSVSVTAAQGTNAGNYAQELSGDYKIVDSAGDDVTAVYKQPTTTVGELVINRVGLTVTAKDVTVQYGEAIPSYEAEYNGFVNGEGPADLMGALGFDCAYTPSAQAGSTFDITPNGLTSDNYEIIFAKGTLTVVENSTSLKASAADVVVPYDGEPHAIAVVVTGVTDYTVEYSLDGVVWSTAHPSIVNVDESAVVKYRVSKPGHTTVSSSASVTIDPRAITVKANDATETFTGSQITVTVGTSVTDGALVSQQQELVGTVSGSGTDVGSHVIALKEGDVKVMAGTADLTGNYKITYLPGTLTITQREINLSTEVEVADKSKTYGEEDPAYTLANWPEGVNRNHFDIEFTRVLGETARTGYTINATITPKAGYEDSYVLSGEAQPGTLTINPRAITLQADDASRTYTGSQISVNTDVQLVNGSTLAGGQTLDATATGSGTAVGSYDIEIDRENARIMASADDVTENYDIIDYLPGTLTITQREINLSTEVKVADKSKTYGEEDPAYTLANWPVGVNRDHFAIVFSRVSGETARTGYTINATITPKAGYEDSYVLSGETQSGTLTINPRAITLQADDASRTYTGTLITATVGASVTDGTLADGQTLDATATGSGTAVGSYDIEIDVAGLKIMEGTANVTGNYDIVDALPGTLTITPREINLSTEVEVADKSKTYGEGDPTYTLANWPVGVNRNHFDIVFSRVLGETARTGYTISATITPKADYEDSYVLSGESQPGTLTITPRAITVKADDASRTYTGSLITVSTDVALVSGSTLAGGQTLDATATGSGTEVGSYDIEIDEAGLKIMAGADNVTGNYEITYRPGTLTITKGEINLNTEVKVADKSKTYGEDDPANTFANWPVGVNPDHFDIEFTRVPGETARTGYTISATITPKADYEDSYVLSGEAQPGTLTITPRAITVKADDASRTYTGSLITVSTDVALVSGSTLAGRQTLDATATGSGTAVGSYDIEIDAAGLKIMDGTANVAGNYEITYLPGTLTITQREIDLTAEVKVADKSKTYGEDDPTYTLENWPEGVNRNHFDIVFSRVSGETARTGYTINATITPKAGYEDSYDLSGEAQPGTLTINPRAITLQADDASRTYTGSLITVSTDVALVNGSTLAGGQTLDATATGSGTAVGSYDIEIDRENVRIMAGTDDVTENYDIVDYLPGTLTITSTGGNTGGGGGTGPGGNGGSNLPDSTGGNPFAGTVTIDDGDVPLGDLPDGIVSIEDGDTPLGALPSTGGIPIEAFLALGAVMMGGGATWKLRARRKNRQQSDSEN